MAQFFRLRFYKGRRVLYAARIKKGWELVRTAGSAFKFRQAIVAVRVARGALKDVDLESDVIRYPENSA